MSSEEHDSRTLREESEVGLWQSFKQRPGLTVVVGVAAIYLWARTKLGLDECKHSGCERDRVNG